MSQTSSGRKRRLQSEINVVPYIDVMLVLLVIFMVTAPLLSQGVKVQLPGSNTSQAVNSAHPFVVTVDRKGNFYINHGAPDAQTAVDADTVRAAAKAYLAAHPKQAVYVRADKDTPYQDVVRAMSLLQQAGATKLGLPTRAINKP